LGRHVLKLIATLSGFAALSFAGETPDVRLLALSAVTGPPPGYEWKPCIEDRIRMLVPRGWKVQSRTGNRVFQCAASADFAVPFTGLEMAIFTMSKTPDAESPRQQMEKAIAALREGASEFVESTSEDGSYSYRNVRIALKNDRGILSWAIDKSNGSIVHLILTAPSPKWAEMERVGSIMIRNIAVNTSP
jgi:hypothetical protein